MSILNRKDGTDAKKQVLVYCCDCKKCRREEEGRSFNIHTGEYFMGRCMDARPQSDVPSGLLFVNKPRECENYAEN